MIGTDIIDWEKIKANPKASNERYVKKVLTDKEQIFFENSSDPERFLWSCWALKEAAYKAWFKLNHLRFFAPKKYECSVKHYNNSSNSIVNTPFGKCYGIVNHTDEYVHATISIQPHRLGQIKVAATKLSADLPSVQSKEVRHFLNKHLQLTYVNISTCIEFVKSKGYLTIIDEELNTTIDVSISHHGSWGGIAFG